MKKVLIFILVFYLVILSGCEGRIELNDMGIVTMMGIDWDNDTQQYEVTMNVIKYTMGNEKGLTARNNSWIASAKGITIESAIKDINSRSSRKISGVALSTVLIGKEAGEKGIEEIADFLTRSREYRDTINIFSTNNKASYIMKLLPQHELDINQEIERSAEYSDWLRSYAPTLRDVYVDYDENHGDLVTGFVSNMTPSPYSDIPRKEADKADNPNNIAFLGGCTIYKNGKLVGQMDEADTSSFLLATRKDKNISKKSDIIPDVECTKDNSKASFEVESLNSSTDINLDNKITVNINIKVKATLTEFSLPHNIDIEVINSLQNSLNKKLKERVESMLTKTQQLYDSDILGVYSLLHKKYPQYWKENKNRWDKVYPTIKFNVTVDSKVTQTGLITDSFREE